MYTILVRKPEGKRLLGRPRRRWEGNVRMDIREMGRGFVWTGCRNQRRAVVKTVTDHRSP
jgi:hypothetical protein